MPAASSTDTSVARPASSSTDAMPAAVRRAVDVEPAPLTKPMRISEDGDPVDLMIWRPSNLNKHGFACLFQFACSMMDRARKENTQLYIDLNQSNSLYDSFILPSSQANWWNDIFLQPYERSLRSHAEVKCMTESLQAWRTSSTASQSESINVKVVDPPANTLIWNVSGVWGPSKSSGGRGGGGGGLDGDKVKQTRALV